MPVLARRRRFRALPWLVAGAGLLALLGVWSWYASRPALVWYVSPRIGSHGSRVRVLVPAHWAVQDYSQYGFLSLVFQPSDDEWPKWLGWFPHAQERPGVCSIYACSTAREIGSPIGLHPNRGECVLPDGEYSRLACRWIVDKSVRVQTLVIYARQPDYAFDATHSAICNSLRIE